MHGDWAGHLLGATVVLAPTPAVHMLCTQLPEVGAVGSPVRETGNPRHQAFANCWGGRVIGQSSHGHTTQAMVTCPCSLLRALGAASSMRPPRSLGSQTMSQAELSNTGLDKPSRGSPLSPGLLFGMVSHCLLFTGAQAVVATGQARLTCGAVGL